jgi:hypothetical protein
MRQKAGEVGLVFTGGDKRDIWAAVENDERESLDEEETEVKARGKGKGKANAKEKGKGKMAQKGKAKGKGKAGGEGEGKTKGTDKGEREVIGKGKNEGKGKAKATVKVKSKAYIQSDDETEDDGGDGGGSEEEIEDGGDGIIEKVKGKAKGKKAYIELDDDPEVGEGRDADETDGMGGERVLATVDQGDEESPGVGPASPAAVEQTKVARIAFLHGLSQEPHYQEMVTALASSLV